MKISSAAREGVTKVLLFLTAVGLLTGLLSSCATNTSPEANTAKAPTSAEQTAAPTPEYATTGESSEEFKLKESWRNSMAQIPLPNSKACFKVTYPKTEWQETQCTTGPKYPMPPQQGIRPLVVGNGDDVSPQVPSGFISTAIGSFDTVTGVTSESSPIGNTGPQVPNAYTLQINTNTFTGTACAGSTNPGCRGWQQFVFENTGSFGRAFIQYWLIRYNKPCPTGVGWNQFSFSGSTDIYCFKNNLLGPVSVPNQPIANLGHLILTGAVSSGGDSVSLFDGTTLYSRAGDNAVNAASGWQIAEFNIFGDGGNSAGGGQAVFNSGAKVVPRTRVIYGGTAPPNCVAQGFTGETNNLSFGPTAPGLSPPGPALLFTESTAGGSPSDCAGATAVGDTHLKTFNGLAYDFQASGDFTLAQVERDFVVQTRQVSGAPTWPNATVNNAVAAKMGQTQVAICLPGQLNIDGKAADLGDGKSLSLPDNADVTRIGNVYFMRDQGGNFVRAQINPTWIDVSVGLGHWPANVKGLLANPNGNVNQIEASDGTVLTNPFPFEELYHHYADSWRVPEKESLLSVCRSEKVEHGAPEKLFFANDLEPELNKRARNVCTAAGVKEGSLLDDCTLDVAVIGDDKAAQVFVGAPAPIVVAKPIVTNSGLGTIQPGLIKWWPCWGVLLLVLLALILWIFLRKRKTP